jgi:3-isopropylmalate dehydrogenase
MKPVALLPGDGIGKEVMPEVLKLHHLLSGMGLVDFEVDVLAEDATSYLAAGGVTDFDPLRIRERYSAVVLGALGDPRIPDNRHAKHVIGGLRQRLDLSVNLRPVRLRDLRHCPLKHVRDERDVDLVIVRENTEDIYLGVSGTVRPGQAGHLALEVAVHSRWAVERALTTAFEVARSRPRRVVTLVDKNNVMIDTGALWHTRFAEIGASYPEVRREHLLVDAAAMELVRSPQRFDVLVTTNLFGDILSDLAAQLVGGLGVAPSASYDPADRQFVGVFEAVHGSAHDIAGTGRANPLASIMSYSLLLRRIGAARQHQVLEDAVTEVLRGDVLTADLGGNATTAEVGDEVCRRITVLWKGHS